jgi:hypothetical protein
MSADREPRLDAELIRNAPALARLAAGAGWRVARWSAGASLRTGARMARAAADPVLAAQVVAEIGQEVREYARDLLGVTELDERVAQLMPAADDGRRSDGSRNGAVPEAVRLRVQGARLLQAAAQIDTEEHAHPAYARILTELAPDEGRILRLLATEGAQPSVDVRAANLIGVGSEMIAGGLSMIGAQAGCQHRDRIPAYLNNLERLGLIWFSREPIGDTSAYQVLEAQPDVLAAIHSASRAKTVQRSINLTPFGRDFCRVCLPLDVAEAEELAES